MRAQIVLTSLFKFLFCLVVLSGVTMLATDAKAQTPANTLIQNQATATYTDEQGNSHTAQSNLATVIVQQVFAATIDSDRTLESAAGQEVYFHHILTNTGNGTDTYTIDVSQLTGDSGDFTSLTAFRDSNENGVADPGEVEITSVTLDAGERVGIAVAASLPGTATDGSQFGSLLTVTAASGSEVTDTTTNGGRDTLNGTNSDFVTISGDAVLNVSKSAIHDTANRRITYTITVTNTGRRAADDVVLFDGFPAGTTYVANSASGTGFGANSGDVTLSDVAALSEIILASELNGDDNLSAITELDLGLDLDGDGTLSPESRSGVFGLDASLPSNTTVTFSFDVTYDDLDAVGDLIRNQAYVRGDLDGDGSGDEPAVPSNEVVITPNKTYGVVNSDTGADPDNDGVINDIVALESAAASGSAIFPVDITNQGTGTDSFDLTIDSASNSFPDGTLFSFWDSTGQIQLLDTDSNGVVDTGPLDAGETRRIEVRALLPSDASETDPVTAELTATSTEDPGNPPASDPVTLTIGLIDSPVVDIANNAADDDSTNNNEPLLVGDLTVRANQEAQAGETIDFPISIQNDSITPDSFQLFAGSLWDGTNLGGLPEGWDVVFEDSTGQVITVTPTLQPGESVDLVARVTPSSDPDRAMIDVTLDADGDGNPDVIDGNNDGDSDYPIYFRTQSASTGAEDIVLNSVDIAPLEIVSLTPDGSGQIQPGGSIDYPHTLLNGGNTTESFTLSAENTLSGANWGNNLLVDTTGDGQPDANLATLTVGDTVFTRDAGGNLVAQTLPADLQIELAPGAQLPLTAVVFAPTTAANGQVDALTIQAIYNDGTEQVTATDQTTVVFGQLRLTKSASVDASCADAAIQDLGPDVAFVPVSVQAAPGDCVIWQLVVSNEGAGQTSDIEIFDLVPAFTDYEPGSLRICDGAAGDGVTAACSFVVLTDGTGDDEGEVTGSNVDFRFAQGSTVTDELAPGESVTLRFATRVN